MFIYYGEDIFRIFSAIQSSFEKNSCSFVSKSGTRNLKRGKILRWKNSNRKYITVRHRLMLRLSRRSLARYAASRAVLSLGLVLVYGCARSAQPYTNTKPKLSTARSSIEPTHKQTNLFIYLFLIFCLSDLKNFLLEFLKFWKILTLKFNIKIFFNFWKKLLLQKIFIAKKNTIAKKNIFIAKKNIFLFKIV